ncbi:MAG: helix-turn-helix transcriptional regulator [Oscillibacter sp.]|nr:helix-turn-helix transcriptional regulator [Oscillibacter sp.]
MKTRVRELRTAAGMTRQQLAEQVRVSARTIISIEKAQYSPSLMPARRMAEVFGVTVEELCCLRENRELEDKLYEDLSQKEFYHRPAWRAPPHRAPDVPNPPQRERLLSPGLHASHVADCLRKNHLPKSLPKARQGGSGAGARRAESSYQAESLPAGTANHAGPLFHRGDSTVLFRQ